MMPFRCHCRCDPKITNNLAKEKMNRVENMFSAFSWTQKFEQNKRQIVCYYFWNVMFLLFGFFCIFFFVSIPLGDKPMFSMFRKIKKISSYALCCII